MSQLRGDERRDGALRLLESSFVYEAFQRAVGKNRLRRRFVSEYVQPRPGDRLLDFGCGPGDLVPFVPEVRFVGCDISATYLATAKQRYGDHAAFHQTMREVTAAEARFDIATCIGVLHHIDDESCISALRAIRSHLSEGGRFLAVEPHQYPGQHRIARFLISQDRGRFVRAEHGYSELLEQVFEQVDVVRDEQLLRVPYTLSVYSCSG